jgi:predicted RNA binding protein YcfA (HicA-like mRNA interferase family)
MPPLERDEVEAGLKKKGFAEEDGDHRFYKLKVGERYTGIFTKTSRGKKYKTLGDDLVSAMAKQIKLTRKEFIDLVSCPMSHEQYLALLKERDEL